MPSVEMVKKGLVFLFDNIKCFHLVQVLVSFINCRLLIFNSCLIFCDGLMFASEF